MRWVRNHAARSFHRPVRPRLTAMAGLMLGAAVVEALEGRILLAAPPAQFLSRGMGGGGALFSPSFSPTNSNELYVVTDMSEIYHSTNLGQSWTFPDFRQIQGNRFTQVQFTSDPKILYALDTSDGPGGVTSVKPSKSVDGGQTWAQLGAWTTQIGGDAVSLYADPHSTQRLIATDYSNLYYSSDAGQTWTLKYTANNGGDGCYIGGVFWDPNGTDIYVGSNVGLLESNNSASTFAVANVSGINATAEQIFSFTGAKQNNVVRLFTVTWNQADVYPGMISEGSPTSFQNVYSLDVGQASWVKKNTGIGTDHPFFVSMTPTDINTVYLAGTDSGAQNPTVEKSTNAGGQWTDVLQTANNQNVATGWQGAGGDRQWSYDQFALGFQVAPGNANVLAFSGLGFVHVSSDGGATWRQAYVNPADQNPAAQATPQHKAYHGIGLEDTSALWMQWSDASNIFTGYTDINGVRSADAGASWAFPNYNGLSQNTIYQVSRDTNTGTLYAASSSTHDLYQSTYLTDSRIDGGKGRILFSTDKGATWSLLHDFGHPVIYTALDPAHPDRLYASVVSSTVGGIYVTNNLSAGASSTWTKLTNPPRTQGHPYDIKILTDGTLVVTYSGRRDNTGFTNSSGVFVSTDGGTIWADRTDAQMDYWTKEITIDPTDPSQNTWYAAVRSGYGGHGNGTGGLYKTTNRGTSWTKVFSSVGVESSTITSSGEIYVATTENGLYYSGSVVNLNLQPVAGYPFRSPERIFINPFNANEVWVTSFGWGISVGSTAVASTGSISGNVYRDVNADGIRQASEPPLAGHTVWLDQNNNIAIDPGEATAIADANGNYSFPNLAAGTYHVREVLRSGFRRTQGGYIINLASGQNYTGADIGDTISDVITGNVYNDLNANGTKDVGEFNLPNWTVFVDANGNGTLDAGETTALTDGSGNYKFVLNGPGVFTIREVVKSQFRRTAPGVSYYSIGFGTGQIAAGKDWGNTQKGIITGTVFNDANANGAKDSGEPGLAGWTVYLDTNGNGQLDAGDTSALTNANGVYAFNDVAPGQYTVREVLPTGWKRTLPAVSYYNVSMAVAGQAVAKDFGNVQGG